MSENKLTKAKSIMETVLKILSITIIIIGGFAIISAIAMPDEDTVYALLGGGLFLTEGILALVYIEKTKREGRERQIKQK